MKLEHQSRRDTQAETAYTADTIREQEKSLLHHILRSGVVDPKDPRSRSMRVVREGGIFYTAILNYDGETMYMDDLLQSPSNKWASLRVITNTEVAENHLSVFLQEPPELGLEYWSRTRHDTGKSDSFSRISAGIGIREPAGLQALKGCCTTLDVTNRAFNQYTKSEQVTS